MLMLSKFKLLIIQLLLVMPLLSLGSVGLYEDKLDEFITNVLSSRDDIDKFTQFDTLYYSMKELGYDGSESDLLWEIFLKANQANDNLLISNSLSKLLSWHYNERNNQLVLEFSDSVLRGDYNIKLNDSLNLYSWYADAAFSLRLYEECFNKILIWDDLAAGLDTETKRLYNLNSPPVLSNLFFSTGLYHESIVENKKEIRELLQFDSSKNIALVASKYNNIGLAWNKLGELDSAMKYFDIARNISLATPQKIDTFFFHLVGGNIGSVLMMKKEYKTAIALLSRNLQSSIAKNMIYSYTSAISSLLDIANCYLALGNYSQAMIFLDSTHTLKNLSYYDELPQKYFQIKANVFYKLGLHDSAYLYAKKYAAIIDSIQQKEKNNSVISLEMAFDTKKKEHLISKQEKQLESEKQKAATEKAKAQQQKYILYISLLGLASVLIILFFIIKSRIRQKRINRLLEQKNEKISTQAENLQKLDKFKEAMTSMLAHDLKNPLNTITSLTINADNLEQKQIKQAGSKMLNLVVNLLDISKYENSNMPLKLNNWRGKALVENAIQRVSLLAKNKFLSIKNHVADSIYLKADIEILERVFENLLTNAIKYSPVNGTIIIRATALENDQIKFSILDEGEGIPENHKEKLFDKYYQVDAKKSGKIRSTGLGLAFCKMAIEAHEGSIAVESLPDKGSEFWFTVKKGNEITETEAPVLPEQKNSIQITLDKTEKKELQHIIKQLQKTEYYEFSKIRKIIAFLENNPSENIKLWRKLLLRAVNSGNEDRYQELIN